MVVYGSEVPDIEAEWMSEKKDVSEGTYLIDFWTYTCLDCIETAEELSKLHDNSPLEVVGVHAPEFGFEHEGDNIERVVEENDIRHSVVLDHDKSTWKSFGNRERPRQVIVKNGEVAWKDAGSSETLEEALKEVLELEEVPELNKQETHSPMLKLGFSNSNLAAEHGNFKGEKELEMPSTRKMNTVYLSGKWIQEEDFIEAAEDAVLKLKFRASKLAAVIEPQEEAVSHLELDSDKPEQKSGSDVEKGRLEAERPDLYELIEAEEQVQSELTLQASQGMKIYGFSFR